MTTKTCTKTTSPDAGLLAALCLLVALSGCNLLLSDQEELGRCGDGHPQTELGEECDGQKSEAGVECLENCKWGCGDGLVRFGERCDDGNLLNGDGCSPGCNLFGKLSVFAGVPGGQGLSDGVGPAARLAGVHSMVYDDTQGMGKERLLFWDNGACSIRTLDLTSGKVQLLAGAPGDCRVQNGKFQEARFLSWEDRNQLTSPLHQVRIKHRLYHFLVEEIPRFLDLMEEDVQMCLGIIPMWVTVATDGELLYTLRYEEFAEKKLILEAIDPVACEQEVPPPPQRIASWPVEAKSLSYELVTVMEETPQRRVFYISEDRGIWRLDLEESLNPVRVAGTNDPAGLYRDHLEGTQAVFGAIAGMSYVPGQGLYVLDWTTGEAIGQASLGWSTIRRVGLGGNWSVATVAGVAGELGADPIGESDGFGIQARLDQPRTLVEHEGVLYFGEDASIRALNLDSGQVATSAGQLVQDLYLENSRIIAAAQGRVYLAARGGRVLLFNAGGGAPQLVDIDGDISQTITSMAAHEDELFVTLADSDQLRRYTKGMQGELQSVKTPDFSSLFNQDPSRPLPDQPQPAVDLPLVGPIRQLVTVDASGVVYLVQYQLKEIAVHRMKPEGWERIYADQPDFGGAAGTSTPGTPNYLPFPWDAQVLGDRLFITVEDDHRLFVLDMRPGDSSERTWTIISGASNGDVNFCTPLGLTTDGHRLFVGEGACLETRGEVDPGPGRGNGIREVELLAGEGQDQVRVTPLIGPGMVPYFQAGTGAGASVNRPAGLAYDNSTGNIFVADMWDNAILKIE